MSATSVFDGPLCLSCVNKLKLTSVEHNLGAFPEGPLIFSIFEKMANDTQDSLNVLFLHFHYGICIFVSAFQFLRFLRFAVETHGYVKTGTTPKITDRRQKPDPPQFSTHRQPQIFRPPPPRQNFPPVFPSTTPLPTSRFGGCAVLYALRSTSSTR